MEEEQKEILKRIDEKTKKQDSGCVIWTGYLQDGFYPRFSTISIRPFIWDTYSDEKREVNDIVKMTCDEKACVSFEHMRKVSKAQDPPERIWERLLEQSETTDTGCIVWTGTTESGYGRCKFTGYYADVHRTAFAIANEMKEIPLSDIEGNVLEVRHLCNNRACFNPEHLALGTQVQNQEDRVLNGTAPRGKNSHLSTITEELAKKIKLSKYPQDHEKYKTMKTRADEFGVSFDIIRGIDYGQAWAYLPDRFGKTTNNKRKEKETREKAAVRVWTDEMYDKVAQRILEKSEVSETLSYDGVSCRLWTACMKKGYGYIYVYGLTRAAHIVSCEVKNRRRMLPKEVTRHLCGRPACVQLEHLCFGTHSQNTQDSIEHGTFHFMRLTNDDIRTIRATFESDGLTIEQRAIKYDISIPYLKRIQYNMVRKNV